MEMWHREPTDECTPKRPGFAVRSMRRCFCGLWILVLVYVLLPRIVAAQDESVELKPLLQRLCFDCHGSEDSTAGVDLQKLADSDSFAAEFRDWQKAAVQLEEGTMPPKGAPQPTADKRRSMAVAIRSGIRRAARRHEGDPGHVVMRRLTSAEYGYTIQDLTGIELDVTRGFVSDAVGGAGFTNTGIAQFVQDSTLNRYLEAATQVAEHAVIGAGPLRFHRDPGQTGFELSAITRILDIYRRHGFRSAAGEGGEPFGLKMFPRAFYAAWRYQHRDRLNIPDVTFVELARDEGIDTRFVEYIYEVVTMATPTFPTSDVVERWKKLPVPDKPNTEFLNDIRASCKQIAALMHDWQSRFGANADAKEEAPVLRADLFDVTKSQLFEMNVNWPKGTKTAHLVLSVESANRDGTPNAVIVWKKPEIQFRIYDKELKDPEPLKKFLTPDVTTRLKFGRHPRGGDIGADSFVTVGTKPPAFEIPIPPEASSALLLVTAALDTQTGDDCIVRCTISQLEETDQGKSVSAVIADPKSDAFAGWKSGVLEFARLLPQVSQREPAPSDRDPIPDPFDTTYNNPERNAYHTRIKYHRDDAFLVQNILDDETRIELDQAWADLLGSFEFHDRWLQFLARKFRFEIGDRGIADVDSDWIKTLPVEAREYVTRLQVEYRSIQQSFVAAESGHINDVLACARRAWRRPLLNTEVDRLSSFYRSLKAESGLNHREALRALITRVLVAPAFLYRAERSRGRERAAPLSDWELANRLSYFLWSSLPDDELRQAAAAGELSDPKQLARQVRRMLRDPKARRFATEFFGQWFGFYRFDQYRGIDGKRFPEFSESLRAAMYEEAVTFFDHIVRNDRPVREILFADYSFLNNELATHYGFPSDVVSSAAFQRVDNIDRIQRGGLLKLGAVLTVTSAPLRTSPVKRGDWILRRVLGTPVPPPPADAGSIAADDVAADGKSIRDRLLAHRRDVSCHNCHSRFDALGFALEEFDPVGRRRVRYRDGGDIDTSGKLRDGSVINGDTGLRKYLTAHEKRFHHSLCTRLLGYALGRRDAVGDLSLIERMKQRLQRDGGLTGLVEEIVGSRQFRYHAGNVNPE